MKNRFKKLSIILAAALILTTIPASAFAVEPTVEASTEAPTEEEPTASVQSEGNEEENEADKDSGQKKSTEKTNENNEEPAQVNSEPQNENGGDPENGEGEDTEKTESDSESDNDAEDKKEEEEEPSATPSENEAAEEETLSENEAEEEVSENAVSENEVEEEETVSENEVSENSISENEVSANGLGGNIDMTMDYEEETVAAIAEAGEEKMLEYARIDSGDMSLDSVGALESSYFSNAESHPDYKTYDADTGKETNWCWAYTAATIAEINMKKKGINSSVNPEQIVMSTYNTARYDYYGETWNKPANVSDFDINKVNNERDYTAYIKDGKIIEAEKPEDLACASGNLIYAAFNFERWAAPAPTEQTGFFEGNTDRISAELENAVWVPNNDIDSIKSLIREYGAAGIQVKFDDESNNNPRDIKPCDPGSSDKAGAYKYYPIEDKFTTNYTVALVGWDNGIGAENFEYLNKENKAFKPQKSGAFLAQVARNSKYGLDYEYMWISYDDAAFKLHDGKFRYAVAYDFANNEKNDYTYGYDGTNYYNTYYTRRVYGIFKSGHTGQSGSGKVEMLKSIGIGVQDAGKYKITIYSGYDPSSAKQYLNSYQVESQLAKFDYPGFHTVELDEPIIFFKDDVISVSLEKADATNFNVLVDGFETNGSYAYTYSKNSKGTATYNAKDGGAERIAVSDNKTGDNGYGVAFNSYTHTTRESAESYFATASNSTTVVSGNRVPVSGKSTYMKLTPRMRLYTSDIEMPSNIDQSMLDIKLSKYVWEHTGKKVTPLPEVMIDFTKTQLGMEATDRGGHKYRRGLVMYNKINGVEKNYNYIGVNNTNPGIAAVIVRGKGDIFSGEISAIFKISDKDIDIAKCKILGLEPQNFRTTSGNLTETYGDIKDNMIIKYYLTETKQYVTLTEGEDYTIGSIEGENAPGKKLSVMITGLGAFTKTIKPKFQLQKQKEISKNLKHISDSTVSVNLVHNVGSTELVWTEGDPLMDYDYTGQKIKMDRIELYDQGRKLVEGVDYDAKIKYKNNKNPGMAKVIIKAKKGGPYTGKVTRYFMIKPMHVTRDAKVKFKKSYTYTGNPIKAVPTVTYFGKKLKKSDLYVAYSNNTGSSTGTAKAQGVVFGKGRYMGYIGTGTFTINPPKSTTSSSSTKSSSSSTSSTSRSTSSSSST